MSMILIKNIEIYSPKYLGIKDVLISGGQISLIEDQITTFSDKMQVIQGDSLKMFPGFIDQHVHITGGGGEGSFKTRVPEITLSKLIKAGITTVVGLLGTDGTTRNVENLVAKAKSLKEEGVSAFVLTGSYEYPTVTLTDSTKKDIIFIDEVIGAKVALSDHRSASITTSELARLASDVRVAGMLSGKAGVLCVHMGSGKKGLSPIFEILQNTDIPMRTIRPTHVNREEELLFQAFNYAKMGGMIDLTCGMKKELRPASVIKLAEEANVPMENITMSSDGYGSWSKYDAYGNLIEIGVSQVSELYDELKSMVTEYHFDIESALQFLTTNVAKALNLYPKKGVLSEGADADILLLDKNMDIQTVIAKGKLMMHKGEILEKGTYE